MIGREQPNESLGLSVSSRRVSVKAMQQQDFVPPMQKRQDNHRQVFMDCPVDPSQGMCAHPLHGGRRSHMRLLGTI